MNMMKPVNGVVPPSSPTPSPSPVPSPEPPPPSSQQPQPPRLMDHLPKMGGENSAFTPAARQPSSSPSSDWSVVLFQPYVISNCFYFHKIVTSKYYHFRIGLHKKRYLWYSLLYEKLAGRLRSSYETNSRIFRWSFLKSFYHFSSSQTPRTSKILIKKLSKIDGVW